MIRKFNDLGEALKFGREFSAANGCRVVAKSVYLTGGGSITFVFGPSSMHLTGSGGHSCSPAGGWHFGNGVSEDSDEGRRLLGLAEADPLPGAQENFYGLIGAHTVGFTHDEKREMAAAIVANGSCVWHEANKIGNRKNGTNHPCMCGKCKPKPKAGDPKPQFHRGRV